MPVPVIFELRRTAGLDLVGNHHEVAPESQTWRTQR